MTTLDKSFGDRVSDTSSSMSEKDSSSSDDFYGRKIIVQIHKREDLVQGTWINNQEVKCEQGKEWIEELELENLTTILHQWSVLLPHLLMRTYYLVIKVQIQNKKKSILFFSEWKEDAPNLKAFL